MSWRVIGRINSREHWTVYLLATGSNLFLSVPLYIAARAGILALLSLQGTTATFVSKYGVHWGIALDFLWSLLIFQSLLAILTLALAGTSLLQRGVRSLYAFSAVIIASFVGYWLGARFVEALSWVSLLHNSGIDSSSLYSDLFWFGLGATIFYVGMILVLRRSYGKLTELKAVGPMQSRAQANSRPSQAQYFHTPPEEITK